MMGNDEPFIYMVYGVKLKKYLNCPVCVQPTFITNPKVGLSNVQIDF